MSVFLLVALNTAAQSGRKAPNYPKYPAETTVQTDNEKQPQTETLKSKPEVENNLEKTLLLPAGDAPNVTDTRFSSPENMQNWVFDRLSQSKILDVGIVGGQTNQTLKPPTG